MKKPNELFKKYYFKILLEGALKALVAGLIVGFGANFLAAAIAWMVGYGEIWLPIVIGAGVAVVSGVLAYFFKYQPTSVEIAKRVDRLGLEERLITMLELENDDSYIAMRQREDAKRRMEEMDKSRIKLRLSRVMIVLVTVFALLGGSMTTVVKLAADDIIPSGDDVLGGDPYKDYIAVSYVIEDGGEIVGEADQLILPGEDAEPVTAIALDGWVFVGWEDGLETPGREDKNITQELIVYALFQEIGDMEEGEGGDSSDLPSSDATQEGDSANDLPGSTGKSDVTDSDENGSSNNTGNPDTDNTGDGESDEGGEDGENEGDGKGQGASGKWEDKNQIIDNNHYYQDELAYYKALAEEILAQGGEIPEDLREFIEKYYDSI